ncbi:MAG: flagellar basal-body MS-ring/collar protein FliF [Deltaproteobacteria bacterium]|nr:flagellar basal-body MS-ring/collar protein FliF [Deltaproteobacteria bacterium]
MPMPDWLQNLRTQFLAWPLGRRLLFAATAVGSLAFFAWLGAGAGGPTWAPLFRGIAPEEMARVVEVLDGERIPYQLAAGGNEVQVPADRVYAARIQLAGQGLPAGGGAGFELFDKPDFGVTDFVHRVNYRRALQGELARSIAQLEPVMRARVQIALPERSPFVGDRERKPSASVIVELHPGAALSAAQVRGVVHLVSSSVEGLAADRVTVVDGRGRMLAPAGDDGVDPAQPAGTGEYQARLERELGQRVEAILAPVVGAGRVVAQVRADLDWTQTEETEERFDPDSQIERSEQRTVETDEDGVGLAEGPPGVASNVPGTTETPASSGGGASRRSSRTSETINYELSKTVRRSVEPSGTVRRLTVAVLLDGKSGADGGFTPWEEPALRDFEALAKRAIGFSEERGDQLTIANAAFQDAPEGDAGEAGGWSDGPAWPLLAQVLRGLVLLAALALAGVFVVRPLLAALGGAGAPRLPARVSDLEVELGGGTLAAAAAGASGPSPAGAAQLARARADESVKAIQSWLQQG